MTRLPARSLIVSRLPALLVLTLSAVTFHASPAVAKEPVERFLDRLRGLEMHDMSVMYLESLRSRPNLDPDLKAKLPYEEGVSLMAGARSTFDPPTKLKMLDQAVARFQEFIKANPKHPRVAMANTQTGNILVERAKVDLEKSKKPINAAQKDTLVSNSRKLFDDARKVFEEAEKQFEAKEKEYPKLIDQKTEPKLFEERAEVRQDYMQSRLFAASVLYEYAKTYDPKDPKFKELMTESAKRYESIADRWRQYVAGLYALMWAGRNWQEMGDRKKALALYGQLLAMEPQGDTVVEALLAETLALSISCWIHPEEKLYDEALKQGEAWLGKTRNDKTAEGLGVHWMLSEANFLKAGTIKANSEKKEELAQRKKLEIAALKHAKIVASFENDYRKQAQERVANLSKVDMTAGPPKTFADARERAQEAVENSQVFGNEIKDAKTEKEKVDLAKKKSDAEKQALKLFQLALALKNQSEEPVPIDLVNRIRHVMCYLNFQQQNYYDAAVIGEFLAQRYPSSPGAKQAAKIALACYVYTFNVPGNQTPQFDIGQMEKLSRLIVERWKGEPEADEALMKLADIYLNSGRIDEAIEALGQITEASPIRPLANTKAGHALWSQYIRQSKSIEGPLPPEVAKLRTDAEAMMKKGIPEMRKQVNAENPPSMTLLTSEISLTQLYVETGRAPEAIKLLEMKPMGLLEMAAHESTKGAGVLRGETYKSGLRAYVSVGRPDDAEKMMNALDKEYAGEDAAKLTRIYVTLGKELERQLADLPEEKKAERKTLLGSFEKFLSRITQRSQGNTYATLNWIAETFYALGKGTEARGQPTPDSKAYFGKAVDAYKKILAEMEKDKAFGPQNSAEAPNAREQNTVRLRVKLANCTRRMGEFESSVATLKKIISENPTMLEAQLESAYTYQAWALVDPTKYKEAISGVYETNTKTKKQDRVIWGWAHMSTIMQKSGARNPGLMHYFHEARFNLNRCRQLRSAGKPADEKKKDLEGAENDILVIARLYPDLGGPDWAPLYKKLFSEIRTALSKQGTLEMEQAKMTKPASATGTATAPEGKEPSGGN